jgi:hypothetical protein
MAVYAVKDNKDGRIVSGWYNNRDGAELARSMFGGDEGTRLEVVERVTLPPRTRAVDAR